MMICSSKYIFYMLIYKDTNHFLFLVLSMFTLIHISIQLGYHVTKIVQNEGAHPTYEILHVEN